MSITFSREDGCWNCWNRLTFYPWKDAAFPSKRCHLWREPEVHNLDLLCGHKNQVVTLVYQSKNAAS